MGAAQNTTMGAGSDGMQTVTVKINHCTHSLDKNLSDGEYAIEVSPQDTVKEMKKKISEAVSESKLDTEYIQVTFGPSEKPIGQRFHKDPLVNEEEVLLGQYSFLEWLDKFPHWCLTARLIMDMPPPPGVAIKKAAATAEKQDPEEALETAYKSGELLRNDELPAPWGPKGIDAYKRPTAMKGIGDNPLPYNYGDTPGKPKVKGSESGFEPAVVEITNNILDE